VLSISRKFFLSWYLIWGLKVIYNQVTIILLSFRTFQIPWRILLFRRGDSLKLSVLVSYPLPCSSLSIFVFRYRSWLNRYGTHCKIVCLELLIVSAHTVSERFVFSVLFLRDGLQGLGTHICWATSKKHTL